MSDVERSFIALAVKSPTKMTADIPFPNGNAKFGAL